MQSIHALTWDHPRGYAALEAAAGLTGDDLRLHWDRQALEGFESHPIADLCARYDIVVLDHPHLGDAVAAQCLTPLEEVFEPAMLARLREQCVGPSYASYLVDGQQWALPLDAATQVAACRADLTEEVPVTWMDVAALSERTGKVALSLAGPHALLTFLSMCAGLEEGKAVGKTHLVSTGPGLEALDLLQRLAARSPAAVRDKNPIGLLAHMASEEDVVYCPLVYGYVNYAAPEADHALTFRDAPRWKPGGRIGSTAGGTGIAISSRCRVTPSLTAHLAWLMSQTAQCEFIPTHAGQPSLRAAWCSEAVNARWGGFYRNTLETMESAWVRPRHRGYTRFQNAASAYLRDALDKREPANTILAELERQYAVSVQAASAGSVSN